jgi:Protein of unknown function (DUF3048) N-terminal domain/Protein of unknown function (DUF3048) C-terminal domain
VSAGTSPCGRGRRRRSVRGVPQLLAGSGLALVLAACGSGSHDTAADDGGALATTEAPATTSAPSTSPSAAEGTSPAVVAEGPTAALTGLRASKAMSRRPVVAVDIASGRSARGLDAADVVFQESGSGSVTRYIGLYQSKDAKAGPVGPTRPADGKLLGFFRPVLANTGGPKGFVAVLHTFPVVDATPERAPSAYSGGGATRVVSTARLRDSAPSGATAPSGAFTFADEGDRFASVGGRAARALTVTVDGARVASWTYAAAKHGWTSSVGPRTTVANVIVEQVRFKTVQTHHPVGQKLPSAVPFGDGDAVVVSGPRAARGSYRQPGPNMLTNYADAEGVPLRLQRGRTWIVLVPADARIDVR